MNTLTKNLIDKINEKLDSNPLIYFAKDSERALGLEKVLNNYFIACIDKSHIVDELAKDNKVKIFCTDDRTINLDTRSTHELVSSDNLKNWIAEVAGSSFYAQLFQFNGPTYKKLEELGGKVLNNNPFLNRKFEDKFSQFKFLKENNIPIPESQLIDTKIVDYTDLAEQYGDNFVIQLDRAHTGLGTFIIHSESDFIEFLKNYQGNLIKVSRFIDGQAYTINGCITKKGVFVAGLQYQITGYKELTAGEGSTVGNDWSYANSLSDEIKTNIFKIVTDIGTAMSKSGYRGLFGIDFILSGDKIFVIEINARQTANTSMQTKLELSQNLVPLSLLHLAEFLDIELDIEPWEVIYPIEGSQVFLRSRYDEFIIRNDLKSGVYRLQSDNSAVNWSVEKDKINFDSVKNNVIFIDEDMDKPLILQKEGYSVDDIDKGGFILYVQKSGLKKEKFDEIARMQFLNRIINDNKLAPWIVEAMGVIERHLK